MATGHPDYWGESFYGNCDAQIQYLYIESQGGYSKASGSVVDGLMFPATSYLDNGHQQTYRQPLAAKRRRRQRVDQRAQDQDGRCWE